MMKQFNFQFQNELDSKLLVKKMRKNLLRAYSGAKKAMRKGDRFKCRQYAVLISDMIEMFSEIDNSFVGQFAEIATCYFQSSLWWAILFIDSGMAGIGGDQNRPNTSIFLGIVRNYTLVGPDAPSEFKSKVFIELESRFPGCCG